MSLDKILAAIDAEITTLQRARALLAGIDLKPTSSPTVKKARRKTNISPEGRARIAEAVKRRWAAQKKAAKSA